MSASSLHGFISLLFLEGGAQPSSRFPARELGGAGFSPGRRGTRLSPPLGLPPRQHPGKVGGRRVSEPQTCPRHCLRGCSSPAPNPGGSRLSPALTPPPPGGAEPRFVRLTLLRTCSVRQIIPLYLWERGPKRLGLGQGSPLGAFPPEPVRAARCPPAGRPALGSLPPREAPGPGWTGEALRFRGPRIRPRGLRLSPAR